MTADVPRLYRRTNARAVVEAGRATEKAQLGFIYRKDKH